ncbi:hypothetical protein MAR_027742 [Mya arenaria]|uniref:Uncharacterized protein n=1 Tax=Mya arenaria TaxID=6604 RepID=A0ABY7EWD1_MYAAR|nr:hypothetical protein MAR_027742 [Mya arenaria]
MNKKAPRSGKAIIAEYGVHLPSFSPRILQRRELDSQKQTEKEKEKSNEDDDIDNAPEPREETNAEIVAINKIELLNEIDETISELYIETNERLNKGTETLISISDDDASKILEMLKVDDKKCFQSLVMHNGI